MSEQQFYSDLVQRHEQAYEAFSAIYAKKNPPPGRTETARENRFSIVALAVLLVASIVVSASRTIPEFAALLGGTWVGYLVGVAGFIMLEVSLIVYAFIRTRNHYDESRHASVKTLINVGLGLSFVIALAVGIHATLKASGFEWWIFNLALSIALGSSAPILAFISGDIIGMLVVADASRQRRADDLYREQMEQWRAGLNEEWSRRQSQFGAKIDLRDMSVHVSKPSNGLSIGQLDGQTAPQALPSASTLGHRKVANAAQIVRDYLTENPGAIEMNSRELAALLGVGKSTVNNVQQEFRSGGQS